MTDQAVVRLALTASRRAHAHSERLCAAGFDDVAGAVDGFRAEVARLGAIVSVGSLANVPRKPVLVAVFDEFAQLDARLAALNVELVR